MKEFTHCVLFFLTDIPSALTLKVLYKFSLLLHILRIIIIIILLLMPLLWLLYFLPVPHLPLLILYTLLLPRCVLFTRCTLPPYASTTLIDVSAGITHLLLHKNCCSTIELTLAP